MFVKLHMSNTRVKCVAKGCYRFLELQAICPAEGCADSLCSFSYPPTSFSRETSLSFSHAQGMHPNMKQQGYGNDDTKTVWQHDLWSEEWTPIATEDEISSSSHDYSLHASVPTGGNMCNSVFNIMIVPMDI